MKTVPRYQEVFNKYRTRTYDHKSRKDGESDKAFCCVSNSAHEVTIAVGSQAVII